MDELPNDMSRVMERLFYTLESSSDVIYAYFL